MLIKFGIIINTLGVLLMMVSLLMTSALPFSYYYGTNDNYAIFFSAITTFISGFIFWISSRKAPKNISKREGILIVSLGWIVISVFNALPYIYYGVFDNITDAIFESVSGITTTGASIISDIESIPKGLLFWRSLTQWIGGMGIIVLTVAIFPLLGIGGIELFVAETPGPTSSKIHPRIKETAKKLWFIYFSLTIALTIILYYSGMSFFDAINHGLTTMATGGFSTKNESIAFFNNTRIEYIITVFMFIAGINYTITYYIINGRFRKVWNSDEFKVYLAVVLIFIAAVSIILFFVKDIQIPDAIRISAFQIVSIMTTTGYVSADYTSWMPLLTMFFFVLLFSGGCAGSTSGGIKIIRLLVLSRISFMELKKLLHPQAIFSLKIDKKIVSSNVLSHILVFLLFYVFFFVIGTLIMTFILADFEHPLVTSIGAVASSLGNVGPAIGELGPSYNFAGIPSAGKWVLILFMLLGRLELFTLLIIFTPAFWNRN